jgi:hypothetical protein
MGSRRSEAVGRSVQCLNGVRTIWFDYLGLAETFGAGVSLFFGVLNSLYRSLGGTTVPHALDQ